MAASASLSALVVGAGPVGLTAALELARRGIEPRIIDAASGPIPEAESRALAVNPRTLQLLEPSGVTERMLAEGLKMRTVNVYEGGQRRFGIDLAELSGRHPYMLMLPQARTQRLLIAALAELEVEPRWNLPAVSVDAGAGIVSAGEGGAERLAAGLIVGADGARSVVREQAGISFTGRSYDEEWGLADIEPEADLAPAQSHVMRRPGGEMLALFPNGAGGFRLIGSSADAVGEVQAEVGAAEVAWQSTFRISARRVGSCSSGRVHLAGDAAHVHSPLGGRGMNLGIEDAAWLAWMANEGKLDHYSAARVPVARDVVRMTDGMTRLLTRSRRLGALAIRHGAPTATRLGPLRRRSVRVFSGLLSPDPPWLEG